MGLQEEWNERRNTVKMHNQVVKKNIIKKSITFDEAALDKCFIHLGWKNTTDAFYNLDYTPFMGVLNDYMTKLIKK